MKHLKYSVYSPILLLFTLFSPLFAQTTLEFPAEVEPFKPIVVNAITDKTSGGETQYVWKAPTVDSIAINNNSSLHIWAKPGEHIVSLIAVTINWETKKFLLESHEAKIVVKGAVVNPPVPPTPPTPEVKAVAALVVYEKDNLSASQALVLNSAANSEVVRKYVKVLDQDARTTEEQPYLTAVREHIGSRTLPVVIAITGESSLGVVVELPKTANELVQLLNSWGLK